MEQKKGMYIYKKELEHCYHRCRFFFILRQLELSIDICLSLVSGVPLSIRIRCHHASDHAEFGRDLGPGQSCFRIQVTFKIYLKFMTNVNGTTGLFIIISVSANRLFFTTDRNQNTSSMLSTVGRSRRTRLRMDSSHWQALGIRGEYITIGLAMVVLISVSSSLLN